MEITKIIALIIFIIILSIIYINNPIKKIENFEDNDTDRLIIKDMKNNITDSLLYKSQNYISKEEIESNINTNQLSTSKLNVNGNIDVTQNANIGKNIIIGNEGNKWILHSPDDNRKSLFIAPLVNGKWDWNKKIYINSDGININDGNLNVNGNIVSKNINTKSMKVNRPSDSKWPSGWGQGVHSWDVYVNGTVGAGRDGNVDAYLNRDGNIGGKNIYISNGLNTKGGKSVHNPNGWGTHFPWSDGKNYIRGDTEIRGNVTKIGNTIGSHCIIYGPGNRYSFCFQGDGHPVQYKDGRPVWWTGKFG